MTSLYDDIGGRETIEKMVPLFYERILADPLLSPFFEHSSMDKLKHMQIAFFTIALGGPEPDTTISLYEAHQGRGIQSKHLTRFTEHLMETLNSIGVSEERAWRVYERVAIYSNDILGDSSVDG